VATKRQVESKLRELIKRLDQAQNGQDSLSQALPDARVVEVYVPDLEQSFWTELAGGRMGRLHSGPPGRSDIRVEADSDVLVDLVDGQRSIFSSYLAGRVKVEASFTDLMRLRRLA
jgi:hypothetical protein